MQNNHKILYIILILFFSCNLSDNNSNKKYFKGMVVSAHPEASKIGLDILKKGGNAVDASIAVQYALAVCYPIAGNLGGGGFMVYRSSEGEYAALDFREMAPIESHRDMYLDSNGNPEEWKSLYGCLSAGVPGTVNGLFTAHKRYGRLSMQDLIEPSIRLAKNGFKLTKRQANNLNNAASDFKKYNKEGIYLFKEGGWEKGDVLIQKDLANTLTDIKEYGLSGFYKGKTADKIIETMQKGEGIISKKDLLNYSSVWRKPITGKYKDITFTSMPLPSSGGILLKQLLKMSEQLDFSKIKYHSSKYIHWLSEMERRVYSDRSEFLGDTDFIKVPLEQLCSDTYIIDRFQTIDSSIASKSIDINHGNIVYESEETTHLSVVDGDGNAVSVTTTINGAYGSRTFVKDCGFLLNNEMNDFSIKAGHPNLYGLVGSKANEIVSQKRMLSSMTPTILEKEGELYMILGSPGGSTIITSVFQTILNVVEYNMGMQEAVNQSRFHHQWKPDVIFMEKDKFNCQSNLKSIGHDIKERNSIGRVDAILVLPDGSYEGGADPRGDDSKMGY
tara:strand:+ start:4438 stop:6114 length:1677 start_codon:yes stop_codon:yes gene_type:complete